MDEDDEGFPRVTRYMLEQVFEVKAGEFETHYTAVITVIGDAPLAALQHALKSLNYEAPRYQTLQGASSGIWRKRSRHRLPHYGAGLIVFSEQSNLGLYLFAEEVDRYREAGISPLLVRPRTQRFTNAAKKMLARYQSYCPIVYLDESTSADIAEGSDCFIGTVMTAVEAILLPGVYPGMICIDTADIACVHANSDLHVLVLPANRINELVATLESVGTAAHSGALAALYGPHGLKLREIQSVIESARRCVQEDATFLQSAIADEKRSAYTLYLVSSVGSSFDTR